MMMIEIAVVIPARNREHTLAACLESVINQTYRAAEIIVVDDGSVDGTSQVALQYAPVGVRCKKLEVSCGAQAARNEGIRLASCDWIAFMDSDDIWLSHKLETQVKALMKYRSTRDKVIHCNAYKRNMQSGQLARCAIKTFSGKCYEDLLLHPGPMFPGLLVHRPKLYEIGLLDEACPSYQEWDTAIRLANVCEFIHVQELLFEWRWHTGDTISKDLRKDFIGFQYVVDKHRDEIIRVHGNRGWIRVKSKGISRGLKLGCFDEVLRITESSPPHFAYRVARSFAKLRYCPPGIGLLMRLAALSPI